MGYPKRGGRREKHGAKSERGLLGGFFSARRGSLVKYLLVGENTGGKDYRGRTALWISYGDTLISEIKKFKRNRSQGRTNLRSWERGLKH